VPTGACSNYKCGVGAFTRMALLLTVRKNQQKGK
jgi:hypothetical protein